jgi:hypothetical protein
VRKVGTLLLDKKYTAVGETAFTIARRESA